MKSFWQHRGGLVLAMIGLASLCVSLVLLTGGGMDNKPRPPRYTLVPEFAPVDSVVISEILFNENFQGDALAEAIIASKARLIVAIADAFSEDDKLKWLKERKIDLLDKEAIELVTISHDTQWIRDYGPLAVATKHGNDKPRLGLIDLQYKNEMRLDDTVPYQLALYFNSDIHHIPMHFDGGNFLTDGRNCYMTSDVRKQLNINSREFATKKVAAEDWIKRYFRDQMGCHDVVMFENAPHEHIDMWAKIVNKDTVLVNEITEKTLEFAMDKNGFMPKELIDLRDGLDDMAKAFSQYLKVERIPMPAVYRNTFRTYTNSLLVNQNALVPQYKHYGWQGEIFPDDELTAEYEKTAENIYKKFGYNVKFVPSDGLIFNGGALHCVAQQIPDISRF